MTGPSEAEPRVLAEGTVITIREADYCYGLGPVTVRLTIAVDLDRYPHLEWITVSGTQVLWNGNDGPARSILVRVAALRTAQRNQS